MGLAATELEDFAARFCRRELWWAVIGVALGGFYGRLPGRLAPSIVRDLLI